MKRIEQLHKLSKEHHGSLVMAKKISRIAEEGSKDDLIQAIDIVKNYYNSELNGHFLHEEKTIFSLILKDYKEHTALTTILLDEHEAIRLLVSTLEISMAREHLAKFGLMLKHHTRMEERELFPIVEEIFSDEQLDAILDFKS